MGVGLVLSLVGQYTLKVMGHFLIKGFIPLSNQTSPALSHWQLRSHMSLADGGVVDTYGVLFSWQWREVGFQWKVYLA